MDEILVFCFTCFGSELTFLGVSRDLCLVTYPGFLNAALKYEINDNITKIQNTRVAILSKSINVPVVSTNSIKVMLCTP